nr:cilia- and flagella-associated protein 46 [Danio rerio]|eukprot:XP_021336588.1 cilia- and flagella-associated protein 46 [Danio rerio]
MDLRIRQYLSKAEEKRDAAYLRKAYDLLRASDARSQSELSVLCAEQCLQLGCWEMAEDCLMMFWERKAPVNQFLCRAHLCQGQLISSRSINTAEDLEKAVMCFLKAIEIAKDKCRYHFLVFNASLLYFQAVRRFLRPGQRHLLVNSLSQVLKALEEVQDPDHAWRAELMLHLVECLLDAGKRTEAADMAKVTYQFIDAHNPELRPRIVSILVRHNLMDVSKMLKDENPQLLVIHKIQKLKHMVDVSEIKREDGENALMEILQLLIQTPKHRASVSHSSSASSVSRRSAASPNISPRGSATPPVSPKESTTPPLTPKISTTPPEAPKGSTTPPISTRGSTTLPIVTPKVSTTPPLTPKGSTTPHLTPKGSTTPPITLKRSTTPPITPKESPTPPVLSPRGSATSIVSSRASISSSLDHSSSIPLSDRVDLLLELAFLSLQLQHPQTAVLCLKELRETQGLTVGQRVLLECVQCELDLHTHPHRIEKYSRSAVEFQLSVLLRLEALLQKAMKEADAAVVQAVCVCVWNTCLPLLQHNLRRRVKKPLITLTRALEDTHSVLLDVLCCAHAELASVSEDEESLESAVTHLERSVCVCPQSERLSSRLHHLCLRASMHKHTTPAGALDHAHTLILQAGEVRGRGLVKKCRPLLVRAGITLAPEAFQSVLDADRRITDAEGLELLAAKAQHHISCVQKVEEHLSGLNNCSDHAQRVRLWASLAKTARKQEVFDVCVAACRFCLLYDDGRWRNTGEQESAVSPETQRELLRLLAEVHFISAEVTILKLRSEGVELNGSAVPPDKRKTHPPEDDAHWKLYSDWIKDLSAYAIGQFLRGAELGVELCEAWLVVNAAVYLWNYSRDVLSRGEYLLLLPTFSRMLELLRHTGHAGELVVVVLLCDAVAQGLLQQCVCVDPEPQSAVKAAEKTKKSRGKIVEKTGFTAGPQLETAALQDIRRALEVCEYALKLSNGNIDPVPIMVRKKLLSTWVSVKQQLQQQIGLKLDINDESENEAVSAMSRVLIAVEMLQCNRKSKLMEFTVPALSVLVEMASGVQWSDPAVELCVWTQLALSAHQTRDHDLVLTCTHNALQLEQSAVHRLETDSSALLSVCSVQEMLSSAACVRGQSLLHEARAHHSTYMEGLRALLSAVRLAEQAGSWPLCVSAAGLYWTSCVSLLDSKRLRAQLREPLELILKTLTRTHSKHTRGKLKQASVLKHDRAAMETSPSTPAGDGVEELELWSCVLKAVLSVHADAADWRSSIHLLEEILRETADATQHRVLLQQRVELKARSCVCVLLDVQQLCSGEDELFCSAMWRRAALCTTDTHQQIHYYHNAITALKSSAVELQKVDVLLEFSEFLYHTHSAVSVARLQLEHAIHLLLRTHTQTHTVSVYELREVSRLERLLRAHTLLAVCQQRTSHTHLQLLLSAYSCTLHIWKVSIESAQDLMCAPEAAPAVRSSSSRRDNRADDKKNKQASPEEDGLRAADVCVPAGALQWAQFVCPEELRVLFNTGCSPYSINRSSISLQRQTLRCVDLLVQELQALSLIPLTFAPLHLAEVIAHDLMENRSLSDLYRLRIIKNCADIHLKSPYSEHLLSLCGLPEEELMRMQRDIANERCTADTEGTNTHTGHTLTAVWLLKAEVCVSMKLFQPARVLLTHTQRSAQDLGDRTSLAKSLLLLAILANEERRYSEALPLLQEAQLIGGDQKFSFQIAHTLMTTVVELEEHNTLQQVCLITEQACRTLRAALDDGQSRASVLRYYTASLQLRGAVFRLRLMRYVSPSVEMLTAVCETLTHTRAELLELGFRTDAAEAALQHAHTLRLLSACSETPEEKQQHLLQAFSLMQTALRIQEEELERVHSILTQHQMDWSGLPVVRVCVGLRLALSDLALFMLELHCSEQNRKSMARNRKSSAERVLEDYLRSSSELSQHQKEWSAVGRSLAQVALTNLSAVHGLSLDAVETRARALGMMGRCLRLLAQQRDPLYPATLWSQSTVEEEEEEEQVMKMTEAQRRTRQDKRAKLLSERRAAQLLYAQASECLSQCVCLSLQHNLPALLPGVCVDLLECVGQCDAASSGQHLALMQSGVCCVQLLCVLQQVSSSISVCGVFSLLNLREKLISEQGLRDGGVQTSLNRELHTLSTACSQLTINPKHLSILGEIPAHFRILLLQHSEDSSVLYGGFYEKVKATDTQKGKSVTGGLICTKVVKASVEHSSLLQLQKHLQEFKNLNKQTLRRKTHESKDKLDESFRALVEEMEEYLRPVLSQFDFSCFSVFSASETNATSTRSRDKEERTTDKTQTDVSECVVILADRTLLEFPLEALSVFQMNGVSSVSRDFSLQILHSRLHSEDSVESEHKKEAKGVRVVKGRSDQSRSIKAGPVSRIPPPNAVLLDTHGFRYVVDDQEEDDGKQSENSSPAQIMRKIITHTPQFTAQWEGMMGGRHTRSVSELEQMLESCSAFIYCSIKSFSSCFPPAKMATLNLCGCQMVLLFDCGQNTDGEHQRLNIHSVVCADAALSSVYLLTLSGVHSVLINQWQSSTAENTHNMSSMLNHLLEGGLTSGRAAHVLRTHRSENTEFCSQTAVNEDAQRITLSAAHFNMVLYGLPHVVVT